MSIDAMTYIFYGACGHSSWEPKEGDSKKKNNSRKEVKE